ncbi:MAG: hypothetical protein HRU69_11655 [Flammeovirgaceae bacterium]|nr:MAG: hypothetical protein HRU69_11655 [Flammeovirgaceae bacterium]
MSRLLILLAIILRAVALMAQEVPFKPDSEFELRINMNFKVRPPADVTKIKVEETFGEYEKRTSNTPLPYVILLLNVVKAGEEEVRLSVSKNGKAYYSRKVETGKDVKLDIGFSDDIKDRTIEHEYEITFLTDRKKPVSRIVIFFSEEGDYLVNGVKRGRI